MEMEAFCCRRCRSGGCHAFLLVLFAAAVAVLILLGAPAGHVYAEENQEARLQIGGDVEFKLRSAWGDSSALLGTGYTPGRFELMQLLSLSVRGQVAPGLTISANLDNRKDGNLQVMELKLDGDPLKGRFGGLSFRSQNPYTSYSARLRGLELSAEFSKFAVGATFGRVQGIAAKKTFQGNTAQETIVYEPQAPYGPSPSTSGFSASLDGMEYYLLSEPYDPDFMGCWIRYDDEDESEEGRSLEETLNLWDLGYLYLEDPEERGGLSAGSKVPLTVGQFVTVSSFEEMLALRSEIRDILRGQIQSAIRSYNSEHGLTGSDQERYPFVYGSETEAAFLDDLLSHHAHIVAGTEDGVGITVLDARADSYMRTRLYDLGQTDIVPGSVVVEVRKAGKFLPVEAELPLVFQVAYNIGVVEFDFPPSFFDVYDAVRVKYRHTVAMGIFNLGLSIAQGSEKVYLNDVLLQRNTDYTIDYELGMLTILRILGPDDVVKVEYEYFRGPFGAMADYKSNFYGTTFGWTPSENLNLKMDVAVYADDPKSAALPEATPAMPNTHAIIGLTGRYDNKGLNLSADLGFSHDQFPFDDNRKVNAANRISGIIGAVDAEMKSYVLIAHGDGISVGGEEFRNYSIGSGIASPAVKGVATSEENWFFATDGGLTVFAATPGPSGQNPFDYVSNWRRIYMSAGLPSNNLTSVVTTPWSVWVGTADKGVASADLIDLETWTVYRESAVSGLPSDAISAIAYDSVEDLVLIGSEKGVACFGGTHFEHELAGVEVGAIASAASAEAVDGFRTFAAAEDGVYARDDSGEWRKILEGSQVKDPEALRVWNRLLWIGCPDGLYVYDGVTCEMVEATRGYSITAVGTGPGSKYEGGEVLWAGTAGRPAGSGKESYRIAVFEVLTPEVVAEHDGDTLGVAGHDPRHYIDIASDEHTATGYAARATARYTLGSGSVYGNYETLAPGFTKIGQTSRQAADIWRLGTQWPIGSRVNVVAEHSQSRTEAHPDKNDGSPGKEVLVISNRVGGTLDIGPKVDISYTVSQVDDNEAEGYEREERTLSVTGRQSFFENKLTLGAGYETVQSENLMRPSSSYLQVNLRGDATLKIDALSVSALYRKPLKTVAPGGSDERVTGLEEVSLNAQWAKQLGPIALRAYYRQTMRDDIATDRRFDDKRAEIRATLPVLSFKENALTPSAVLKWENTVPFSGQARQGITAQGSISGNLGGFRTSSGVNLRRTEYPGMEKLTLDTEVFTTLSSTTRGKFVPQFDIRWKRSSSKRADLGVAASDSLTATARTIWTPVQGLSNVASVAYSLTSSSGPMGMQKHSASIQDTVDYRASEKVTMTGEASIRSTASELQALAGGDGADIRGALKSGLRYRISDMWSLGASVGYHVHKLPASQDGFAHGLTLEAGLRATF
jgi:hypothetical protein